MVVLPSTTVYSVTNPISKSTSLSIDNLITGLGIMVIFSSSLRGRHGRFDVLFSSFSSRVGHVFHGTADPPPQCLFFSYLTWNRQAVAIQYGKRPVYLVSSAGLVVSTSRFKHSQLVLTKFYSRLSWHLHPDAKLGAHILQIKFSMVS